VLNTDVSGLVVPSSGVTGLAAGRVNDSDNAPISSLIQPDLSMQPNGLTTNGPPPPVPDDDFDGDDDMDDDDELWLS